MSAPVPPAPSRTRAPLLAKLACLAVALIAFFILREMDTPWSGKLGRTIYGVDQPGQLGYGEKYRRLIEVFSQVEDPAREKLKVRDWGRIGMRLSSTLVLIIALLGAATAWWWGRWLAGPATGRGWSTPKMDTRSWIMLGLLLVLGAALRWPSARHYMTYDEQDNMRRNYHGFLDYREPGQAPEWVEAGFDHALWENERVNNPYLFSVLSQVSQSAWRAATGAPRERSDQVAMRFPSLFFGWLAIATVFWATRQLGWPRLAPVAGALMAVHALALHHSVEARGYGLNLFMVSLLLGFGWRAMQIGNTRDWLAFGCLVFLCVFSYPGSLYLVLVLTAFIALVLLRRRVKQGDAGARAGLARLAAGCGAAGLLYVWLITPAIPQAMSEFHEKFPQGNLGFSWVLGATVTYATGLMPIYTMVFAGPEWQGPTHVEWFFTHFPRMWPLCALTLLTLGLFATGWVWIWRNGRPRAGFLLAANASGIIMVCHHYFFTGLSLYYWYIIYILPAVLMAWSAGILVAADKLAGPRGKESNLPGAVLTAAICAWMIAVGSQLPKLDQWNDGITYLTRQPPHGGWGRASDPIRTVEIQRGPSLWINTADGYLLRIRDFEKNPEAWDFARTRGLSEWGKLPLPPGQISPPASPP